MSGNPDGADTGRGPAISLALTIVLLAGCRRESPETASVAGDTSVPPVAPNSASGDTAAGREAEAPRLIPAMRAQLAQIESGSDGNLESYRGTVGHLIDAMETDLTRSGRVDSGWVRAPGRFAAAGAGRRCRQSHAGQGGRPPKRPGGTATARSLSGAHGAAPRRALSAGESGLAAHPPIVEQCQHQAEHDRHGTLEAPGTERPQHHPLGVLEADGEQDGRYDQGEQEQRRRPAPFTARGLMPQSALPRIRM